VILTHERVKITLKPAVNGGQAGFMQHGNPMDWTISAIAELFQAVFALYLVLEFPIPAGPFLAFMHPPGCGKVSI